MAILNNSRPLRDPIKTAETGPDIPLEPLKSASETGDRGLSERLGSRS